MICLVKWFYIKGVEVSTKMAKLARIKPFKVIIYRVFLEKIQKFT
jgi:hypothetical protein